MVVNKDTLKAGQRAVHLEHWRQWNGQPLSIKLSMNNRDYILRTPRCVPTRPYHSALNGRATVLKSLILGRGTYAEMETLLVIILAGGSPTKELPE